jgi:hypothetical protein
MKKYQNTGFREKLNLFAVCWGDKSEIFDPNFDPNVNSKH